MKAKISKKVISICLTLLICISALPLTMLSAGAASYNINIRNIVYPRPGAAPQGNVTAAGNLSYKLVGWTWSNSSYSQMAIGPESFKNFYSSYISLSWDFSELKKFNDAEPYDFMAMFVVKNTTIPDDTECTANFYDEKGNIIAEDEKAYFTTAQTIKYMMAEIADISLPDGVTESDTLLMCSVDSMICSPYDHIHTVGDYNSDENKHWRECSVCGKKIGGTEGSHTNFSTSSEYWMQVKSATATQEGEYVKKCSSCNHVLDSVTVPKTGEQTVVKDYEGLRNALAKGGKQWIKLDFRNKICQQEDFNINYTLCVDDPDADITIDLNKCILARTTMYDSNLFEVKQGSLRIWQNSGDNIISAGHSINNNLYLSSTANYKSVFYVGKSGSLRLTNVHAIASDTNFSYAFPIVKSYGDLCIDSGIYTSNVDTPAVDVRSGNVVINGGNIQSRSSKGYALDISNADNGTTTAEINYGNFGSYNTAVSIYNTTATINGGDFKFKDTDKNLCQEYALKTRDSDLTINNGNFYGSTNALAVFSLNSLNITGGSFHVYDQTKGSALYLNGDFSSNTTISGGCFTGKNGIESVTEIDFSKIIPDECYVTDYDTGLIIDHKITAYLLGSIEINVNEPVITTQPSGGRTDVIGDPIILYVDGDNVSEYIWHIIDENGEELSRKYLSDNGYANVYPSAGKGNRLSMYNVSEWMNGKRVYCEAKGYGGTVISDTVELSVGKVIKYCNDIYFDDFDQIWNHKTVGDFKNPKTDANAPYTIGDVKWIMYGGTLGDSYEFEDGDNVAVVINVIPKEGYTFNSSIYGRLNNKVPEDKFKNADGSCTFVFNITITAPDEYKTQNIELSVEEPVAGKTPAKTAKCTSGYAIPYTPSWTPVDTTFKSGTQYTVEIRVSAEYKWGDTSEVTAKVNGNDAEFVIERKTGKIFAYYVVYTFDATKDYMRGDVNGDGTVSVDDVTMIQKYIANTMDLTESQLLSADVDGKEGVSIDDVTQIQKYLASLIDKL